MKLMKATDVYVQRRKGRVEEAKIKQKPNTNTQTMGNYTHKRSEEARESRGRNFKLWWKFKSLTQVTKPLRINISRI